MSEDTGPFSEQAPVEVPHGELPPATLRAVIESFVLREGTDYGERDASFDGKVADVMRQLERREAVIIYDPVSDSVDIVRRSGRAPVQPGS